ncbi:MAG: hypothetical protein R3Y63_07615 [Eubacteriales bacterium]
MDKQTQQPKSRKEVLGGFLFIIFLGFALFGFLLWVTPYVENNNMITSFPALLEGYAAGNILSQIEYLFFDISQLTFLFSSLSCFVMIVLSYVAAQLEVKNSKWKGTGVDGNGKIFPVMLTLAIVSTLCSQLLYGQIFAQFGFIPTLSSFLFFHHFTMFYGVSKEKTPVIFVVTTILATPCCLLARICLVDTLNLPIFFCVAAGSFLFMPLGHVIFSFMPWMTPRIPEAPQENPNPPSPSVWFIHQVFGDIGNLGVNGSSIATMGLVLFTVISYCMNPMSTGVGAGLFPMTIFAMLITGGLTTFLYYPLYGKGPVVSFASQLVVLAMVVTYPTSWLIVGLSIIYATIVPTAVVAWFFKLVNYKGEYCVLPLVLLAVSVVAIPWAMFVQYVLMPLC